MSTNYAVKRFADRYWIERIGGTIHGTPVGINVPKFFDSAEEAWKWVGHLEEGVVDVPRPSQLSESDKELLISRHAHLKPISWFEARRDKAIICKNPDTGGSVSVIVTSPRSHYDAQFDKSYYYFDIRGDG